MGGANYLLIELKRTTKNQASATPMYKRELSILFGLTFLG